MPNPLKSISETQVGKFSDAHVTANGQSRAIVPFKGFETLWFNTGTLCNLECLNCYIESSPRNDRLVYLKLAEVKAYLDEAATLAPSPTEIGFTGGEPFMNPDIVEMLALSLGMDFRVLVLTNAMKPMHHRRCDLLELKKKYEDRLAIRVSLDHFNQRKHEELRGPGSWEPAVEGLRWLSGNGFAVSVAGRMIWDETESEARNGYRRLFEKLEVKIDSEDPSQTILFPEMDERLDVPEITEACWKTLDVDPSSIMCATSRMVVKPKGAAAPHVMACTILPYAEEFAMGRTLIESSESVNLNHPHCARFCVLGGGSCSASK
jgi:pyruvate-formate lyase-activating enzyme